METAQLTSTTTQWSCPGCGAALATPPEGPQVTCPSCGREMPVAALVERQQLTEWSDWARDRATWLTDRLSAGDLPADHWSALAEKQFPRTLGVATTSPRAARPERVAPSVGSLLLAGGATLLVLAGIAFVAFAWDALGPTGQLLTLYLLGGLALVAGVRLRHRLPGTATTLGMVGTLLVAVSAVATRLLAADPLGETAALVASLTAAVVLTVVGVVLRSRLQAVGEVGALVGAALTLGVLASAPVDDALPLGDHWAWWPAAILLVGSLVLLLLAHRWTVVTWPALAGLSLLVGSLVLAGFVADRATVDDTVRPLFFAGVLLVLAPAEALLVRLLPGHRPEPGYVAAVITVFAAVSAFVSGVAEPASRPGSALALAAATGLVLWARVHVASARRDEVALVASIPLGAAVGFLVAPWTDTWNLWRGLVAGLAIGGLLVVLAEVHRFTAHALRLRGIPALAAAVAGLGVWLVSVLSDYQVAPVDVQVGIAATLALLALAVWFEALRRHLPAWSVWLGALAGSASMALLGGVTTLDPAIAPEVYGLALAAVAAVAGVLCWWVRRPTPTPTLVTVGPAVTLLLAPTTLAMLDAATSQWWAGEDPGTAYQVRVVGLFVVGTGLVVVGAWQRLAGVLAPAALAVLIVTAVQLVELGRFLPQWVSFAVAGGVLVAAGARWEWVRDAGHRGGTWVRNLR